ncbi:MAG: PorV/PorQ family protein [candidate division FCPU426 bacterium]
MTPMRFLLPAIALSLAWLLPAAASERGTTGADFLKIGLGAASVGTGEAAAARTGELDALFYNPAGLAGTDRSRISAMHVQWIADTRYESLAYVRPLLGNAALGASLMLLHMPGIQALSASGADEGLVSAYDLGVQFAYAQDLPEWAGVPGLAGGAGLKILHRQLADVSASGAALDLGALYHADDNLTFGLSCQNLGYLSSFGSTSESLPLVMRAGAGYQVDLGAAHTVMLLADAVYPADATLRANLGCEYAFSRSVVLRAGYKFGYDTDGFQAGAGVRWQELSLDYALKVMEVFGVTHLISASLGFGAPLAAMQENEAHRYLDEAEGLYGRSQYAAALAAAQAAVAADPKNKKAVELRDKLKSVIDLLEMSTPPAAAPEPAPSTPDEQEEQGLQPPPEPGNAVPGEVLP